MAQKIILVADPGIDAAVAITLALNDPDLEVLAVAATAGNVGPEQATRNAHVVVEQNDPARWPRIGAALPVEYDRDATSLHGPDGLGGLDYPCAQLHHPHPADKLITDLVRQHPDEVAIVVMGPATALARALDRDTDLPRLVSRVVMVGGAWHEPGDITAAAEFHFWCDPASARQVLRCGAPLTLLPLDVTRKLVLSPGEVRKAFAGDSRAAEFLRRLVPLGLAPTANLYGVEGVYLADVLALVALTRESAVTTRSVPADVETQGSLTRGMTIFDTRWGTNARPNIDLVTHLDAQAARQYIGQALGG